MYVRLTQSIPKTSNFLGGGERWASLNSGFGMRCEIKGTILIAASHVITRHDRPPLPTFEASNRAQVSSLSAEHACRDLTNTLISGIEVALTPFLDHVEDL